MTDLLSQLQRATEGSRNLDSMIAAEILHHVPPNWGDIPHYTTNLQDAVSLLNHPSYKITSDNFGAVAQVGHGPEGDARTAPLALCIAIIKAHESKAEAA